MNFVNQFSFDFSSALEIDAASCQSDAVEARKLLESGSGPGSDFLGWLDLPLRVGRSELAEIADIAHMLRISEGLVVVGIGGSYLGSKAAIEALRPSFGHEFPVWFAGHHMDSAYMADMLDFLKSKRYSINVISKSGTTTEPGLAFRYLWNDLQSRFRPEDLRQLVVATTDERKGALRRLADSSGLKSFIIPDDVGGRFSVLSPVGLLPIAAAGIDIEELMNGAREMSELLRSNAGESLESPAIAYASWRNACYRAGKKIEILASYQPSLHFVAEWWKQLYGESEGKGGRGIFPASVDLSTDLHSMGQWMQDGERTIFETVIDVVSRRGLPIPSSEGDADGLNYLAGRSLHDVNRTALKATLEAHRDGGVPAARFEIPEISPRSMGALFYLFEYACGVSAYMLGVNPFDQPGVEAYKSNMFRLLGKPDA